MASLSIGIRPIRQADRAAVLGTVRAAELLPEEGVVEVAAELDAFFEGDRGAGSWLVATTGSEIAGVAFFARERMTDGTWNLLMLAVHPRHQGQGRGSALVRAVEQDLRVRGARLLVVETSGVPAFAGQRRFYSRLGYRRQGWIEEFFEAGDAKVVFTTLLTAEPAGRLGVSGVRAAVSGDLDHLTELAVAFYAEDGFTTPANVLADNLRALLNSHEARVALASDPVTGVPIGFAVTTTSFGLENGFIAELQDLYVTPDFRRGGVGTILLEDAALWARTRDCARLEVVIAPNGRNVEHLHRFYAAHDFIDDGRHLRTRTLSNPA